jgi:acylphosphatase
VAVRRTALHAIVRGRVQGVGYRAFAERAARRLGLDGWVRNRMDGIVECLVAGPKASVAAMQTALAAGPLASRVDAVDRLPDPDPTGVPSGFAVRPTA